MKPNSEGHDRYKIAPKLFEKRRYKATFGGSRSLELTDKSKVIEAFAHNDLKRVTVIYRGLCSFTFSLIPATNLEHMATWEGNYNGKSISCHLAFFDGMQHIKGIGWET